MRSPLALLRPLQVGCSLAHTHLHDTDACSHWSHTTAHDRLSPCMPHAPPNCNTPNVNPTASSMASSLRASRSLSHHNHLLPCLLRSPPLSRVSAVCSIHCSSLRARTGESRQ
jgi:hypothetical protein